MLRRAPLLLPLLLSWGCQQVSFGSAGHGPDDAGDDEATHEYGDEDPDDGWSEPDLPQRLDAGAGGTDTAADGCHLVDILFVIDNSFSMAGEQQNLIASFEGLINGMREYLVDANDFHVGVVTTDAYMHNPPECQSLGSLVTRTPYAKCGPFTDGKRFMTDEDELEAAFACTARVGTDGDVYEKPVASALAALAPDTNAPGGCNDGFIRDDALLVLVFITDEDDQAPGPIGSGSPGFPAQWFEQIVAAKGGAEANVVMLALVGTDGVEAPNECPPHPEGEEGAEVAFRILKLVDMFSYGYVGDVCASSYDSFFDDTLAVIHTACLDFEPP